MQRAVTLCKEGIQLVSVSCSMFFGALRVMDKKYFERTVEHKMPGQCNMIEAKSQDFGRSRGGFDDCSQTPELSKVA